MFCRKCGNILSEVEKFCPQCGTPANVEIPILKEPEYYEKPSRSAGKRQEPSNFNSILILVMLMLICILVLVFLGFLIADRDYSRASTMQTSSSTSASGKSSSQKIKDTVVTASNYEEMYNTLGKKINNEKEGYYFTYACMYYRLQNGLSREYLTTQNESLLYENIYNKTVQNLIDEGKDLMKETNMTVEKWKKQLEEQK